MNPLTNVKNTLKLNERMLEMGVEDSVSWHKQYKDSAYIFIGGLPYGLTEGDILCVFSQYGEIVNINLARDSKTGETKGFCFLCYEDQRSTILAVDNFNGIKLGGRTIRVDHCSNYRRPKSDEKDEDGNRKEIIEDGCAPKTPPPSPPPSEDEESTEPAKKRKKEKKAKKNKKSKKNKELNSKTGAASSDDSDAGLDQVKKGKVVNVVGQRARESDLRSQDDEWKSRREEKHKDSLGKGWKDNQDRYRVRDRDRDRDRDVSLDRSRDSGSGKRERYPREDQQRRDLRVDKRDSEASRNDRHERGHHSDLPKVRDSRDSIGRRDERREREREQSRHSRQDRDSRHSEKDRRRP